MGYIYFETACRRDLIWQPVLKETFKLKPAVLRLKIDIASHPADGTGVE